MLLLSSHKKTTQCIAILAVVRDENAELMELMETAATEWNVNICLLWLEMEK